MWVTVIFFGSTPPVSDASSRKKSERRGVNGPPFPTAVLTSSLQAVPVTAGASSWTAAPNPFGFACPSMVTFVDTWFEELRYVPSFTSFAVSLSVVTVAPVVGFAYVPSNVSDDAWSAVSSVSEMVSTCDEFGLSFVTSLALNVAARVSVDPADGATKTNVNVFDIGLK